MAPVVRHYVNTQIGMQHSQMARDSPSSAATQATLVNDEPELSPQPQQRQPSRELSRDQAAMMNAHRHIRRQLQQRDRSSKKKTILYFVLLLAILALVYGLYCLSQRQQ